MKYKKLIITGGAGFVGSNLAIYFKKDNPKLKVITFDNLKRRGSELNLNRLREAGVEFIHGDIRNKEDLNDIDKFDIMIECSAEPSVLAGFNKSPDYAINTNLMGTINCLEAVRKNKSDIVFLSTSRVYPIKKISELKYVDTKTRFELGQKQTISGVSGNGISEEFPLDGVRSLYGSTKLCSELLLQEYIEMYGIKGIINRCSIITGPWQMGKVDQGIVVYWIAKHIYNSQLSYIGYGGNGKQVRDILHIRDLYDLLCIQLADIEKYNGEIYNVGGGCSLSISLCELTQLCQEVTKKSVKINSIPKNRKGDIPYYITDYSKINKLTGWRPKKSLKSIFEEIAEWIDENKVMLKPILA